MEVNGQLHGPAGLNSGETSNTCGNWFQSRRGCVRREDSLAITRNRTWFLDRLGRSLDTRLCSVSDIPASFQFWPIFYELILLWSISLSCRWLSYHVERLDDKRIMNWK